MKKTLLLLLLAISPAIKSQFQFNYFQGFDGPVINTFPIAINISASATNIWQIGSPQKIIFNSPRSAPNVIVTDTSINYPANNVSTFSFVAVHPYMGFPFALRWTQKLDMDSKKDGGIVEFSTNSGHFWQNAHNNGNVYQFYGFLPANKDTINGNQFCFSGTDSTWRDIWLCLPTQVANQNDTILFRFTFKSDSINTNKEGWMIDNFSYAQSIVHPVKEISQIGNIVVYPNVSTGIVNVEMKKRNPTDVIQNIELFDNEGKLLETYGQNYTKVVLDISKYKVGLYYLQVTADNKINKFKIIYEKN